MHDAGKWAIRRYRFSHIHSQSPVCCLIACTPVSLSPLPLFPMGRGIWWSVAGLTRACGVLPFPAFLTLYPCLFVMEKRRCEITIISFSRSICRVRLAALIEVTGKPYPSCLSCHSHPIRPCGAPSPRGEGCDTRIPSSKKGGEAATRALNPEPNESKVKRSCEEMNLHFFTAPFSISSPSMPGSQKAQKPQRA